MEGAGGPRLERERSRAMRWRDSVWARPAGWASAGAKAEAETARAANRLGCAADAGASGQKGQGCCGAPMRGAEASGADLAVERQWWAPERRQQARMGVLEAAVRAKRGDALSNAKARSSRMETMRLNGID